MKKRERVVKLEIEISVPAHVDALQVRNSIDEALDEPLNDWGDWIVSTAELKHDEVYTPENSRFFDDEIEEEDTGLDSLKDDTGSNIEDDD